MSPGKKRFLKLALRVSVTVILLAVVLSQVDLHQVGQTARRARLEFLIVVWLLSLTNEWVRAAKLQFILKEQQCDIGLRMLFGAGAVAGLYGMIMPGTLNTGVKWYILKTHSNKGMQVFSALAYNQATNIVFVMLLGFIAIIIANPTDTLVLPVICAALAVITVVGTVLLLNNRTGPKVNEFLRRIVVALPQSMRPKAEGTFRKLEILQTAGWPFHFKALAFNVLQNILGIGVFVCAAKGARAHLPVAALVWQCSAVALLAMLPISIANLGVREFTLVKTMAKYGVASPSALLFSAVIFSTRIVLAAIGAVYQITWAFSHKRRQ